jgi:hemerythrin
MALMEWTDRFLIGVPAMDQQHRRLVEMINRLNEAIQLSRKNPAIPGILTELAECTKSHFEEEEKVMCECGYAGLEGHRDVHQKLLRDVALIMEKVKSGKLAVSMSLVNFIQLWLEKHLVGYDQQYARHIVNLTTAEAAR